MFPASLMNNRKQEGNNHHCQNMMSDISSKHHSIWYHAHNMNLNNFCGQFSIAELKNFKTETNPHRRTGMTNCSICFRCWHNLLDIDWIVHPDI